MSDTKAARLHGALRELVEGANGVQAAAVVSFDGLMMAMEARDGHLPADLEEDRVAAMSAALLSLGEQAVEGLGCGTLDQMFAEGDDGFVVMLSAREEAVLTAVADRDAKLGLVLYEMRRAAEAVADALVQRMAEEVEEHLAEVAQVPVESLPPLPVREPARVEPAAGHLVPVGAVPPLEPRPLFTAHERHAGVWT
jgi:uncharacterized protein